jgi:hypothetical protein
MNKNKGGQDNHNVIVHGKSVLKGQWREFLDYSIQTEMENKTVAFCPILSHYAL